MYAPTLLALALAVSPSPPRTFRVDAFHTRNATEERFALDRLVVEPLPFPGNPDRPVDELNLGKYLFEVRDQATNRLLYSRGYATIFGEWETTAEAKEVNRTFHESLRFPAPERPVQVVVKKRDRRNGFREIWSLVVDPKDMFVDPSPPAPAGPVIEIQRSGPPERKLDLLILGDGYTKGECAAFETQARKFSEALFSVEPFRSRRDDFNVRALCPPARESGVSRPSTGIHRNSPVGATFDAFGFERYVLAFDNRRFRELASQVPYDFVAILVNAETYGGGGIQGLYATVAAGSLWAPYVFVHELGHHIAGLADEYFASDVAYLPGERVEPWERNVTTLPDPARPKWAATPGTPLPTPWDQPGYEKRAREFQEKRKAIRKRNGPESEMDALFLAQKEEESAMLSAETHAARVGAFQGANY
ncbi:MAG: M64 family metallo-endopeptidase, partial [Deltaproteobacteria bacterium]|nr:M64 family metallo-endopeptidase [Deltaproteobacteria bacterium]